MATLGWPVRVEGALTRALVALLLGDRAADLADGDHLAVTRGQLAGGEDEVPGTGGGLVGRDRRDDLGDGDAQLGETRLGTHLRPPVRDA